MLKTHACPYTYMHVWQLSFKQTDVSLFTRNANVAVSVKA